MSKVIIDIERDKGRLGCPGHTGYVHYLVLDLSTDEAAVYLHSGYGNIGTPEHLWHGRGRSFPLPLDVDAGDVLETLESEMAQKALQEICGEYLGSEWNGNTHIGIWRERELPPYDCGIVEDAAAKIESLLEDLPRYWDAGDWIAPDKYGVIRDVRQHIADGGTVESWAEAEADTAALKALVCPHDLAKAVQSLLDEEDEDDDGGEP
jgi:hypothetical protein